MTFKHAIEDIIAARTIDGYRVFAFTHATLKLTAQQRYLNAASDVLEVHRSLALYYSGQLATRYPDRFIFSHPTNLVGAVLNSRKVIELPKHLRLANMESDYFSNVCTLEFLEAACLLDLLSELETELFEAAKKFPNPGIHNVCSFITSLFPAVYLHKAVSLKQLALFSPESSRIYNTIAYNYVDVNPTDDAPLFQLGNKAHTQFLLSASFPHQNEISHCQFAFGTDMIVTSSLDCTIRKTSVSDPAKSVEFTMHRSAISDLSLSSDGGVVMSLSVDGCVFIWDSDTGQPIAIMESDVSDGYIRAQLSHNNDYAVLLKASGELLVWMVTETPKRICKLAGQGPITDFAVSKRESRVLAASEDGTIGLWDLQQISCVVKMVGHQAAVTVCNFEHTEQRVISGSRDNTVKIWSSPRGSLLTTLIGHSAEITWCGFCPDMTVGFAASLSAVGELRVWDLSRREIRTVSTKQLGLRDEYFTAFEDDFAQRTSHKRQSLNMTSMSLAMSLQKQSITSSTTNSAPFSGVVLPVTSPMSRQDFRANKERVAPKLDSEYVDVSDGKKPPIQARESQIFAVPGMKMPLFDEPSAECSVVPGFDILDDPDLRLTRSVGFSPNGKYLVAISVSRVIIWDMTIRCVVSRLPKTFATPTAWAMDSKGTTIAVCTSDGQCCAWDISLFDDEVKPHKVRVTGCAVHPQGKYAYTSSVDGLVQCWDIDRGVICDTYTGHCGSIMAVSVSASGKYLLTGGGDYLGAVWSIDSDATRRRLRGHQGPVLGIVMRSDDEYIATCSDDHTVRIWSENGEHWGTMVGHQAAVNSCVFGPSGDFLASGSDDKTVRIWSLENYECLAIIREHGESIRHLEMRPTGGVLLTASEDGVVREFDLGSMTLKRSYLGHYGPVTGCAYVPHGARMMMISSSRDGTLKVWDADTGVLLRTIEVYQYPFSSLAVGVLDGDRPRTILFAGDEMGNVVFLQHV